MLSNGTLTCCRPKTRLCEVSNSVRSDPKQPQLHLGRGWSEFAKQLLLIVCAVLFYFLVRGLTEGSPEVAIQNGLRVLAFEERLAVDLELTAQGWIDDSRLMITLANWTYIWLHWPVIAVTLVWLHRTDRFEYLLLRNAMFVSGAIGLVIFGLFPVAPPRLIGAGFLDTVTEFSSSYRLLQPPRLANKYAAVPSLHVGWNLLVGIALFRSMPSLRVLAYLAPIAMTIAVVLTGNHYIVDAVAGAALALLGLVAAKTFTLPLAHHRFDPFEHESDESETPSSPDGLNEQD